MRKGGFSQQTLCADAAAGSDDSVASEVTQRGSVAIYVAFDHTSPA